MRVNKMLGLAAALTLVVAIAAVAVVWAQAPATRLGKGHAFGLQRFTMLSRIGRQINLTAQQKQQIKDLVKAHKDDIKALVDQRFAARKALRRAIAADNREAMAAAVNQLSTVELKSAELRAQLRARIFSDVLQPDQRSKAGELLATFERRADQRRQRTDRLIDGF